MTHSFDLLAEAACCAWEAMLEQRERIPTLDALWERRGTVHMRHQAIELAPRICEAYDTLGPDWAERHALIPYDWEFVPAIIAAIEWGDYLPDAPTITRLLREKFEKQSA